MYLQVDKQPQEKWQAPRAASIEAPRPDAGNEKNRILVKTASIFGVRLGTIEKGATLVVGR